MSFLNKVEACMVEVMNSRVEKVGKMKTTFSCWDARIMRLWNGLKVPIQIGLGGSAVKAKRKSVKWIPLACGWFKLNFDRAARGNLEKSSVGCIIRNWQGKIVGRLALPLS